MHRDGRNCLRGTRARHPNSGEAPATSHPSKVARRRPPADAPIRADLVKRVRREIADGTYDTPEKWEAAVDRLLDEIE